MLNDIKKDAQTRMAKSVDAFKHELTLLRTGRDALSEIVGADAATLTAEDWPVR